MKYNSIIILLFISIQSYSQTNEIKIFNNLKTVFKKSISCTSSTKKSSIFLNRDQKQLDIDNYLIPLLNVTIEYSYSKLDPKCLHYVKFECIGENCINIVDLNETADAVAFPFGSKNDCYEFIAILSDLKTSLQK